MSIQQLKHDIKGIREKLNPENPKGLIIIYDSHLQEDSEKINPAYVLKINGIDVSDYTTEEKAKMLSVASVHICIPKQDPYPGGNNDYTANQAGYSRA